MKEKKLKSLLIICIIILVLIIVGLLMYNLLKKNIIISSIENSLNNFNIGSNYSYTMTNITENSEGKYKHNLTTSQYYIYNNKVYAKINTYGDNLNIKAMAYKDESDDIILYYNGKEELYKINGKTNAKINMEINPTNLKQLSEEILFDIKNDIDNITVEEKNDKECYVITSNNNKYWIEKDTGIVTYYIKDNNVFDLTYFIGNVSENDIVKPDISKYLL